MRFELTDLRRDMTVRAAIGSALALFAMGTLAA